MILNRTLLRLDIRRIEIKDTAYTIRPSFIMPYMTGRTDEVEQALFMRKFNVPFWALSHVFGKDPMYWYRLECSLGRNDIVGTSVRNPDAIPENLAADEKHTWCNGRKVYVATTVGKECILGAEITRDAGKESLERAYGVFKREARRLNPEYQVGTVNLDGWQAARNAWESLFPGITIICCFLHVFIKIRDRAKRKLKGIFDQAATKLWNCYHAKSRSSFSQRIRRFLEWCGNENIPEIVAEPVRKLHKNIGDYGIAYTHPGSHRTSNMIDRLLQRMDHHLFSTQYFHGTISAAQLGIRGWALIQNFAPSNPMTIQKYAGWKSPAERLNQFSYSDRWLHNLLISASLRGRRSCPPNPL